MNEGVDKATIRLTVNGLPVEREVPARQLLADFLRDDHALTATRLGCEHGVCGSCTVLVDGQSARSCLMLAIQADGAAIRTVEGLGSGDRMHPLQQAFWDHHALQCGFCTSGFLMAAVDLLETSPGASEAEIRQALAGNLCRCTGYGTIVEAVAAVARGKR